MPAPKDLSILAYSRIKKNVFYEESIEWLIG